MVWFAPAHGNCQPQVPATASPQIRKEWSLGEHVARDLEDRDGRIDDAELAAYFLGIDRQLANAAGTPPVDIRLTGSSGHYIASLPNRRLYISAGLLESIQSEVELAGLIAHELAHANEPEITRQPGAPRVYFAGCVLTPSAPLRWTENMREREQRANATAIGDMKAAGYDPSGVLELFSRLAYEHPVWARAIVPDDLLRLRAGIEAETAPAAGYMIDSSRFRQMQARLAAVTGHAVKASRLRTQPTLERR